MLERLAVRGLGIIEEVELELEPGFGALTGETGAGKSLLVESLKLLAGQRSSSEMVRSGDERLQVEGSFSVSSEPVLVEVLDELGIPFDGLLTLRREVTAAGRTRCWVNDVGVTAATLQRLAPALLAIHGQHEQYGLADPAVQRRLVDDFGGLHGLCAEVAEAHGRWSAAADRLAQLRSAEAGRRDRLDAIAFQLAEIDRVAPRSGEDEELEQRRRVLRNAVRLLELSSSVLERLTDLDGAALDAVARAEREVEEMAECGLPLADAASRLGEARILLEESVREIQHAADSVQEDPSELESVESRLHRLEKLMAKYGTPIDAVLGHRQELADERENLECVSHRVETAAVEAQGALDAYAALASELDLRRAEAGRLLAAAVEKVLTRLNMSGTRLEFAWRLTSDPSSPLDRDGTTVSFDEDGVAQCELLIAANPGEELRPMARIASGGELSRLHLALRSVLRGRQSGGGTTLLFDEVDSGVGGATALALGGLLADLAGIDQVLVVTHLPQVAAVAASHFRVEKVLRSGRAVTRVEHLDAGARETELARMLAGEDHLSESARAHARALLLRQ